MWTHGGFGFGREETGDRVDWRGALRGLHAGSDLIFDFLTNSSEISPGTYKKIDEMIEQRSMKTSKKKAKILNHRKERGMKIMVVQPDSNKKPLGVAHIDSNNGDFFLAPDASKNDRIEHVRAQALLSLQQNHRRIRERDGHIN